MNRKGILAAGLAATVVLAIVVLQVREPGSGWARDPGAPLFAGARGIAFTASAREWQERLPVVATLKKGSKQQLGFSAGGGMGMPSGTNRTYTAHLEIENLTGHELRTGVGLYLVETAQKAVAGAERGVVLEVAGGYFNREPLEDFSGAAGFRNEGKEDPFTSLSFDDDDHDAPDREEFGLNNVLSWSDDGMAVSQLGPLITFTTGRKNESSGPAFGRAKPGETLKVDVELELAIIVKRDQQEKVVLVSPRLIFSDPQGKTASFRYLLEFEPNPQAGEKADEIQDGGVLAPKGRSLLPMTTDALLPLVNDRNGPLWMRVFTAQWAATHATDASAPALASIVAAKGSENDALRASALLGLGVLKHAPALDQILAVAADESEHSEVQRAAMIALGRMQDRRALPVLLAIANGKDHARAWGAIASLGKIKDPEVVEPLLRILENNARSELHDVAGQALGRFGNAGVLERLHRLAKDSRKEGASDAVRAMGWVGSVRAIELLADVFSSGSVEMRKAVCVALSRIDRPEALAALKVALQDKSIEVRSAAVEGIAGLENAARAGALMELLRSTYPDLQKRAIEKLADHEVVAAKAGMAALLGDAATDASVRESAAYALGSFPEEPALEALVGGVRDPATGVRLAAIESLRRLEARTTATAVVPALQDGDENVRSAAAAALGEIGGPSEQPALVAAVLTEKSSGVLSAEVDALISLKYQDLASFARLAGRLRDLDDFGRSSLSRLLKHLSGEDFSPEWDAKPGEVEDAIRKWTEAAAKRRR